MDHFFQIAGIGPPEADMPEAYTTLGYLAASTSRARLLTVVGAAWYEQEARALGIPFPPLAYTV